MTVTFIATSGGARDPELLTLDATEYLLQLTITILPMSIATTCLGKIAIGVMILRIIGNTSKWRKWSIWAVLVFLLVASIIDICLGLFLCGAPQKQWDFARLATAKCLPTGAFNNFNYLTIALGAFSDYFFSVLPMVVVWKLNMKTRRKHTLIFLLGLTLVTGAVTTVKLIVQTTVQLSASGLSGNVVYKVAVLFSLEAMFIIVFGSMPVLNPLWESCFEIRQSKKSSQQTRSSKAFSLRPRNKQNIDQGHPKVSNFIAAQHHPEWVPDSNTEIAQLVGYPGQPDPVYLAGGEFTGHPYQPAVFWHAGEALPGYAQQSIFSAHPAQFQGYPCPYQYGVLAYDVGDLPSYPQQLRVFDGGGEGFQHVTADIRYVQHGFSQNSATVQSTHGTPGIINSD
jgi:hypothetical protein